MTLNSGSDKSRIFTPAFFALTLSDLAYFIASSVMFPVVPLFATNELGAGPAGVGFAFGILSVTALVLRPFVGRLSNRLDTSRLLLLGAMLFTAIVAAHFLVTEYWALILLRIALGVADAVYMVASFAALAEIAPPDRRGEAFSYNSLGLFMGIAIGPYLGEWLLATGGFRAAWIGLIVLGVVAVAVLLFVLLG